MKKYLFLLSFNILILIEKISFSLSIRSEIIPIYKMALSPNLNKLYENPNYNLIINDIKGVGLIFDTNSEISFLPMNLMKYIEIYYEHFEETLTDYYPKENNYLELILYYYYGGNELIHFIFEKSGISIPIKEILIYEENFQRFKFLTGESQDNIIIGKDLIELMDIDVINLKINNEKYITKLEEE